MLSKTLHRLTKATAGPQAARAFSSGFEKFDWEDPLKMQLKLTDEEQMIYEVAQGYAKDKLLPRVTEAYQ